MRPAVVVSDDEHNAHMATVTVAPLSTSTNMLEAYEAAVPAGILGDGRPARVKSHQLRAVDKSRLREKMGVLPVGTMADVDATLRIHLGL